MNDTVLHNAWRAFNAGNYAEAAKLCQDILRADQKHYQALYLFGFIHSRFGHFADAERLIGEAIRINPRESDAHYNRGVMLQMLGRNEEALACFEQAVALKPDFLDAETNRGVVLLALKRHAAALECFGRALKIKPDDAENLNNRANALLELKRTEDALDSLERALTLNPNLVSAFSNRGVALHRLGRHVEALKWLDKALAADPKNATALNNRGMILMVLRRPTDALGDFERSLAVQPDYQDALINSGIALLSLQRSDEALKCYEKVLSLNPRHADALFNRANAFLQLRRFDDAARDCTSLVRVDPNYKYALGYRNHFRLQCCDWRDLGEERTKIAAGIRAGARIIPPFAYLALGTAPEDQLACARICVNDVWPPAAQPVWKGEVYRHPKIRIAYLSGDFRESPVATLMAGVFEAHDKNRFDLSAISLLHHETSNMRLRLARAFDRFVDVQTKSDAEVADLLRQMEIDIAVDLSGYTEPCRPGIFAFRAAPLQVNYLGFPGTTGSSVMDYIVADKTVIPESDRQYYSEKVVYLPDCYLPNDSRRRISGRTFTRDEVGLPDNTFVFCSFNNSYKIQPEVFDVWMRLLRQVRNGVLWLPESNKAAMRNLKREAEARGIGASRLIFAPFLSNPDDHLARLKLADLFLDTLPYNAHSTACDALWAGLPLLTCEGTTFAGRAAASLLRTMGLPELITASLAEYENTALRLARDPAVLSDVREKLARHRETSPLFDTERFTRNLEAAYIAMWTRQRKGLAPESFAVSLETNVP